MSSAVPVVQVLSLVWSADVGSQIGFVLEIAPVTGLTSLNAISFICETRILVCHSEAISCHQVSGKGRFLPPVAAPAVTDPVGSDWPHVLGCILCVYVDRYWT